MSATSKYLVSVCITTYNMDGYIARALDSVLRQKTDFDVEIIVSDDASVDKTIEILEAYKESIGDRICILKSSANKGLIKNFVKSLEQANGKYIATLDADDYWIDDYKLQKHVEYFDRNPAIGFVFTNYYNEFEATNKRSVALKKNISTQLEYESYLLNPIICISTPCIRKSVLDFNALNEFADQKFAVQDYPLFLNLILKTQGYFQNDITTVYTNRENSMSRQLDYRNRISFYQNCYQIGDYFIKQYPISSKAMHRRSFNLNFNTLLTAWNFNDFSEIKKRSSFLQLSEILKYQPKSLYIYLASKNKWLYNLVKPWVLRKRQN